MSSNPIYQKDILKITIFAQRFVSSCKFYEIMVSLNLLIAGFTEKSQTALLQVIEPPDSFLIAENRIPHRIGVIGIKQSQIESIPLYKKVLRAFLLRKWEYSSNQQPRTWKPSMPGAVSIVPIESALEITKKFRATQRGFLCQKEHKRTKRTGCSAEAANCTGLSGMNPACKGMQAVRNESEKAVAALDPLLSQWSLPSALYDTTGIS